MRNLKISIVVGLIALGSVMSGCSAKVTGTSGGDGGDLGKISSPDSPTIKIDSPSNGLCSVGYNPLSLDAPGLQAVKLDQAPSKLSVISSRFFFKVSTTDQSKYVMGDFGKDANGPVTTCVGASMSDGEAGNLEASFPSEIAGSKITASKYVVSGQGISLGFVVEPSNTMRVSLENALLMEGWSQAKLYQAADGSYELHLTQKLDLAGQGSIEMSMLIKYSVSL